MYKFSTTENKIQKGRKFFRKYRQQFLSGESLTKQIEFLKSLYQFLPEISWFNTHAINSQEFYLEVKETWQRTKASLYAQLAKDAHFRIIEAVRSREDDFTDNKGRMLCSALSRSRNRIDTTTLIHDGEFIDNPTDVKKAVNQRAETWTRKRRLNLSDTSWNTHYEPLA